MTDESKPVVVNHFINGPEAGMTEFKIKGQKGGIKIHTRPEVSVLITGLSNISDIETLVAAMVQYYKS